MKPTSLRKFLSLSLLCAAMLVFAPLAHADNDIVQFFSNVDVPADSTAHDVVCFFCSANVEGKATGDIVVFFGDTHIANSAEHDVVNFFGHVTADDNASIDHDLVSFFGGIRLGQNVHVGQDMVAMFGSMHTGNGTSVGGNRVYQPAAVFFIPFFILIGVLILVIREFRAYRRRVYWRSLQFPPGY